MSEISESQRALIAASVPIARLVSAGTGLTGGGDLSADRTIALATAGAGAGTYGTAGVTSVTIDAYGRVTTVGVLAMVPQTTQVIAGTGLSGGGALSGDVTVSMPAVGPGAGLIGGSGIASVTLDAQGRVTAAATATYLTSAAPVGAQYLTLAADGTLTVERVFTPSTGLTAVDSGAGAAYTLTNDVLTGKAGGQTFIGGTALGEALTLQSTAHATKGPLYVGGTNGDLATSVYLRGSTAVHLGSPSNPKDNTSTSGFVRLDDSAGTKIGFGSNNLLFNGTNASFTIGPAANGTFQVAHNLAKTSTSATQQAMSLAMTISPTSGAATFNGYDYTYTINQTSTASGTVNGFFANATETSVLGTHNLINLQIGSASRLRLVSHGTASANLVLGLSTTDIASTVLRTDASKTVASAAGAVWDGIDFMASTLTLSGSTNVTTATGVNFAQFRAPTITSGSPIVVTNAATVAIAGAPGIAGSTTITNAYALWVQAGAVRFDGTKAGFFGVAPVVQQTRGATLTNNVTSGGTDDQIDDITSLTLYTSDAATIRNNIYQLARILRQHDVALRALGFLT